MHTHRKIIHIDMDAFYAAVEQRDFPEYRGRPIIVGGSPDKRGVVATCSYEARKFGIHSAMPSSRARRLCPQAIFVRPRFEVYRQLSAQIRAVFQRYTDLIEPLSLDEAYLDVTKNTDFQGSATRIAQAIKADIFRDTRLTASAGVSYNKFLAKIASDMDKPDGLYVITPDEGAAFADALAIGKFHGIGKVTEAKMHDLDIITGRDLKTWSLEDLQDVFGKAAHYYYHAARGIDDRPVESQRVRQSIGSETTFDQDLSDSGDMLLQLRQRSSEVAHELVARGISGRTLTIKVKFDNFEQVTRSRTLEQSFTALSEMNALLPELLAKTDAGQRKVRLLGVTVSGLCVPDKEDSHVQLKLI